MSLLKSPVFIICSTLFILHQIIYVFFNGEIPFVDPYLDTLLAMPIILTLLLFERKYVFKWKGYYRLTKLEIILATVFVAFISEVIFPALSEEFTADWIDVLCFFIGGIIFYLTINPVKEDDK